MRIKKKLGLFFNYCIRILIKFVIELLADLIRGNSLIVYILPSIHLSHFPTSKPVRRMIFSAVLSFTGIPFNCFSTGDSWTTNWRLRFLNVYICIVYWKLVLFALYHKLQTCDMWGKYDSETVVKPLNSLVSKVFKSYNYISKNNLIPFTH